MNNLIIKNQQQIKKNRELISVHIKTKLLEQVRLRGVRINFNEPLQKHSKNKF